MKFILTTHNLTLTKAIEDHILDKLEKLEHIDRWLIDARVTLEHDHTRTPARAFKCAVRIGVRGRDLYAEDKQNDLYTAVDLAVKKLEQQIRKRHNKTKATRHNEGARTKRTRQESHL